MPRRAKRKRKTGPSAPRDVPATPKLNLMRTGMPAADSIIGVKQFKKGKKVYRIIQTDEVDEYEPPLPKKGKRE